MRGAQVGSVAVRVAWPSTMDVSPSSPPGFSAPTSSDCVMPSCSMSKIAPAAEPSAPPSGYPYLDCSSASGSGNAVLGRR